MKEWRNKQRHEFSNDDFRLWLYY